MAADQPVLLLIHGSFADNQRSEGDAWWQRGSGNHRSLCDSLTDQYDCQPFHWSGENLESERRKWAKILAEKLSSFERAGRLYALVAHSHGGSVLWHALLQVNGKFPGLPHLLRWVTVGTPFLHYRSNPLEGMFLLPTILGIASLGILAPIVLTVYGTYWREFLVWNEYWYWAVAPALLAILIGSQVLIFSYLVRAAYSMMVEHRLKLRQNESFKVLRARYVPILSQSDEAISGLAGTMAFSGEIIPRSQRWWGWIYNHGPAALGDQFIWLQAMRRSQGADLPGLVLDTVSPIPVSSEEPRWMNDEAEARLLCLAERRAQSSLLKIRETLVKLAYEALPFEFFKRNASGSGVAEALVHTNYFDEPRVRRLIETALLERESASEPEDSIKLLKTRRKRQSYLGWHATVSVTLGLVVTLLAWGVYQIVSPLRSEQIIRSAIGQAPLAAATLEDLEKAYEFIRSVGRFGDMDQALEFVNRAAQTQDPALSLAHLGMGLAKRGAKIEAQKVLHEASRVVQVEPSLPRKVVGPVPPVSYGALALARAWSRLGRPEEVERLGLWMRDNEDKSALTRAELLKASVIGLAEGGHFNEGAEHLGQIQVDYIQQSTFLEYLSKDPPRRAAEKAYNSLSTELRTYLSGDLIYYLGKKELADELRPILEKITRAQPRILAAVGVAKALGREGRTDEARSLLEAELEAFPKRPRDPIDGLAIHYVRVAQAFLDLGFRKLAEGLLRYAESLPEERLDDTVWGDQSGPQRAILWARFGNARRALEIALEKDQTEEFGLVRRVARILGDAGLSGNVRAITDEWEYPFAKFQAEFGLADASQILTPELRVHLQTLLGRVDLLGDVGLRSRGIAEISIQWARFGNMRRALLIAQRCLPGDFLLGVTAMLEY